jgi:hypothetical protein
VVVVVVAEEVNEVDVEDEVVVELVDVEVLDVDVEELVEVVEVEEVVVVVGGGAPQIGSPSCPVGATRTKSASPGAGALHCPPL